MIPIIAKLAVVAALGTAGFYALYATSHLNQPSASGWVPGQVNGAMNPATRVRSSSLDVLQRRAAENASCASRSWSNAPPCTVGTSPTFRREVMSGENGAHPQLPAPRSRTPDSEASDPSHTGALTSAREGKLDTARRMTASSPPRKTRLTVGSRAQAYAARPARKVRWATRSQRRFGYREPYSPRLAYTPWWSPGYSWPDQLGN
jgi:hypothetical protein